MLTKIINKEKNDFNKNHSFPIPKNIREIINERGFYLYEWIGEQDFKNSLKGDFFNILNNIGPFFGIIFIIYGGIYSYILFNGDIFHLGKYFIIFNLIYVIILLLFLIIIMLYVGIKSIKKSNIYLKNHFILITKSHISINGKIILLKDKLKLLDNLNKVSILFSEQLFEKSSLVNNNNILFKKMKDKIAFGYKYIKDKFLYDKKTGNRTGGLGMVMLVFYTGYITLIWIIYYIGIGLLGFFGIFLSFINKQILLKVGHEITTINNSFENIDSDSKKLVKYGKEVSILLEKAMKNDIKDGLFKKINSNIEYIEAYASSAINVSIKLKTQIKESKYKDMFNFGIYNSWIKRQIYEPILEIKNLLEKNLNILEKTKEDIKKQINETEKESFKATLKLQETRIVSQISSISTNIKMLDSYLQKLT